MFVKLYKILVKLQHNCSQRKRVVDHLCLITWDL